MNNIKKLLNQLPTTIRKDTVILKYEYKCLQVSVNEDLYFLSPFIPLWCIEDVKSFNKEFSDKEWITFTDLSELNRIMNK